MSDVVIICPDFESGACLEEMCNGMLQDIHFCGYADDGQCLYGGFCRRGGRWEHFTNIRVATSSQGVSNENGETAEDASTESPTLTNKQRREHDWRIIRKIRSEELTSAGTIDGTGITEAAKRAAAHGLLMYYKNARSAASAYSQALGKYPETIWNKITLSDDE